MPRAAGIMQLAPLRITHGAAVRIRRDVNTHRMPRIQTKFRRDRTGSTTIAGQMTVQQHYVALHRGQVLDDMTRRNLRKARDDSIFVYYDIQELLHQVPRRHRSRNHMQTRELLCCKHMSVNHSFKPTWACQQALHLNPLPALPDDFHGVWDEMQHDAFAYMRVRALVKSHKILGAIECTSRLGHARHDLFWFRQVREFLVLPMPMRGSYSPMIWQHSLSFIVPEQFHNLQGYNQLTLDLLHHPHPVILKPDEILVLSDSDTDASDDDSMNAHDIILVS